MPKLKVFQGMKDLTVVQGNVNGKGPITCTESHAEHNSHADPSSLEESKDQPGQVNSTNLDSNNQRERQKILCSSTFAPGNSDDEGTVEQAQAKVEIHPRSNWGPEPQSHRVTRQVQEMTEVIVQHDRVLADRDQLQRSHGEQLAVAEKYGSLEQYTAIQEYYAKGQRQEDRQRTEQSKRQAMEALSRYKKTVVEKQKNDLEHLKYLRESSDVLQRMINECERQVAQAKSTAEKRILYDDAESIDAHLHTICATIPDSHLKHLHDVFGKVKHFFVSMGVDVKNRQVAASMALYLSLQPGRLSSLHLSKGRHKAALMTVPPSAGKSVIIAQLAAMVLVGKSDVIDNVVVCFPYEVLLEQERQLFESMGKVFKFRATTRLVHLSQDLASCLTDKTLVIHDEADKWWIDNRNDVANAKYVIGVSATSYNDPGATEAVFLKSIGVKIIDSKIESRITTRHVQPVSCVAEFVQMHAKYCNPGFIFYVSRGKMLEEVKQVLISCGICDIEENCHDIEVHKDLAGRALIVTPDFVYLMRGINYRTTTSIHLLICTSLPTEREYQQALGRVGRFTDSGTRSILKGVSEVSMQQRDELLCDLGNRIETRRQNKQNSKKGTKAQVGEVPGAVQKDSDDIALAKPPTTKQATLEDILKKTAVKSKTKEE